MNNGLFKKKITPDVINHKIAFSKLVEKVLTLGNNDFWIIVSIAKEVALKIVYDLCL